MNFFAEFTQNQLQAVKTLAHSMNILFLSLRIVFGNKKLFKHSSQLSHSKRTSAALHSAAADAAYPDCIQPCEASI